MREPRGKLDLTEGALGADLRGDLGSEDLERDAPVVAKVVCEEDDGHPAFAERPLDVGAAA